MPAKEEEEEEEKNIPVAVKEMEIEYLEGNSDGMVRDKDGDWVRKEDLPKPIPAKQKFQLDIAWIVGRYCNFDRPSDSMVLDYGKMYDKLGEYWEEHYK